MRRNSKRNVAFTHSAEEKGLVPERTPCYGEWTCRSLLGKLVCLWRWAFQMSSYYSVRSSPRHNRISFSAISIPRPVGGSVLELSSQRCGLSKSGFPRFRFQMLAKWLEQLSLRSSLFPLLFSNQCDLITANLDLPAPKFRDINSRGRWCYQCYGRVDYVGRGPG